MNLLTPSATEAQKLESIRVQIADVDSKLATVRRARLPREEIEQRVQEEVADLARDAAGPLGELAYTPHGNAPAPNVVAGVLESPRGLAALLPDVLVQAITDRAIENAGDPEALSTEEREIQLKKLAAQRRKLEVAEECEVLALEAAGWSVGRRKDIDAELVLEVWAEQLDDNGELQQKRKRAGGEK